MANAQRFLTYGTGRNASVGTSRVTGFATDSPRTHGMAGGLRAVDSNTGNITTRVRLTPEWQPEKQQKSSAGVTNMVRRAYDSGYSALKADPGPEGCVCRGQASTRKLVLFLSTALDALVLSGLTKARKANRY